MWTSGTRARGTSRFRKRGAPRCGGRTLNRTRCMSRRCAGPWTRPGCCSRAARLVPVHDLREMCFGIFEGRNYVEMERDPDYLAWVGDDCMGRCPGGESRAEFSDRTCAAFASLVDEALARGAEMLVVMAHGGTQMAVMERYACPRRDYYTWCAGQRGRLYTGCGALADARPAGPCGRSVLCGGSVRWILCWPRCAAF